MTFRSLLGSPPDVAAILALAASAVVAWRGRAWLAALLRLPRRAALALVALVACLLSIAYVEHYLRGGPRVIDATSYWLEARAIAEGHFSWPIEEPTAAARGRFLLLRGAPDAPRLGVIFPPGYPLVLALGFLIRHPLWIGPAIAFLLVIATYALARRLSDRQDVALAAAIFSALCAALRYHTADTMSHGWAALLFAGTLAFAFGASDAPQSGVALRRSAMAGLGGGWLLATRPISAVALLPALFCAVRELPARARLLLALSAIPPIGFFLLEQHAVTGAYFTSSQAAYYAVADGPPGCFRYGFGAGIGCLHEHGDYVASVLPHGFGWHAAVLTTLHRLLLHALDIANAEPLALLALSAPVLALLDRGRTPPAHGIRRAGVGREAARFRRRVLALSLALPSIVLAYAPFYFDGSYPGGGARFFADILPIEHVLMAASLAFLVRTPAAQATSAERKQTGSPDERFIRWASAVAAFSLLGFGGRAAFEHQSLRDREGGRPFFEPSVVAKAHIDHGLLFTSTDHAFNLAYDPDARDAHTQLVVAREYGDDRDRLLWERLGQPTAYRYSFDGADAKLPTAAPWIAGPTPHPYRYEAEAEWPPLDQSGGHFDPVFARGTCAWGGRLLAIRTEATDQPFRGTISFPVPRPGRYRVGVHVASRGEVVARFVLRSDRRSVPLATWAFVPSFRDFACTTLLEEEVTLSGQALLEVTARQGSAFFLDAIALEPVVPPRGAAR